MMTPLPDLPLIDLWKIYARENTRIAGGSVHSRVDYEIQVRLAERYWNQQLAERAEPPRVLMVSDSLADGFVAGCMAWQLSRGRSRQTCNKLRRVLMAILRFGIDEKDLPGRLPRVKAYKTVKLKPRCWLMDEFDSILQQTQSLPGNVGPVPASSWFLALLLFLFNTGTRITATMLTPSANLDLRRAHVLVPGDVQKDQEDMPFDLLPMTVAALAAIEPQRNELIFGDWPYDWHDRKWRSLRNRLKQLIVLAGLAAKVEDVTRKDGFHKFRKTFASYVASKAGVAMAQQLCGHGTQAVTEMYLDARVVHPEQSVANMLPQPTLKIARLPDPQLPEREAG